MLLFTLKPAGGALAEAHTAQCQGRWVLEKEWRGQILARGVWPREETPATMRLPGWWPGGGAPTTKATKPASAHGLRLSPQGVWPRAAVLSSIREDPDGRLLIHLSIQTELL